MERKLLATQADGASGHAGVWLRGEPPSARAAARALQAQPLHKLRGPSGPRPATCGAGSILPCRSGSQSQKDGHPSPQRMSTVPGLARQTGLQRGRHRAQTPQGGLPPITPICLLSRCPCHRRGQMGLRDSAGTRLGPGDTDGLFAQRTCAEHSRILRTGARNRAPWANVLVLSESARTRGGRRTKRGTHEGQRRAASTPEKTDGTRRATAGRAQQQTGSQQRKLGGRSLRRGAIAGTVAGACARRRGREDEGAHHAEQSRGVWGPLARRSVAGRSLRTRPSQTQSAPEAPRFYCDLL